ncbi:MAG: hypothetical protein PHX08_15005 [Lachnospiraceae bacterium]|nr:hypothetical protein [Lachnospiraceae bacterium]
MSVNGVTNQTTVTDYNSTMKKTTGTKNTDKTAAASNAGNTGVVYESSNATSSTDVKKKQNAAIVAQMKADAEARANQLQSLVQQMISKQGNSYGQATDMWQFLASGNYTVDAATKAQAQNDISENGYWGVNQTSDRILDFAKALSNGDPDKMEEMRSAFEKGFKQATKAWGKELPDISSQTYDAVMKKFDQWKTDNNTSETEA